jgi:hypothetical protein
MASWTNNITSKSAEIGRGWQIRRRVSGQTKLLNFPKNSKFCGELIFAQ